MADQKPISAIFLTFFFFVFLFKSSHGGDIAIYWGQNENEGSLADACDTSNYKFVSIAYLYTFGAGRTPQVNLAGHCNPVYEGCTILSPQIEKCQKRGIKVLLSIGGESGSYMLYSEEDAKSMAAYLWHYFLGGGSKNRPFGYAALDGIDFNIESSTAQYWDVLAKALKGYSDKVVLAAAPQCPYPNECLHSAIQTGVFDYVWVRFYNKAECQYSDENEERDLLSSWKKWSEMNASSIFVGLPASPSAASKGGYISSEAFISKVLPVVQTSSKFGGVMLWNRYYDLETKYSENIKPSLDEDHVQKAIAFE